MQFCNRFIAVHKETPSLPLDRGEVETENVLGNFKLVLSVIILVLSLCTPALHNKNSNPVGSKLPFDVEKFNSRYRTAQYLVYYDSTARRATDSVMNEPASVKSELGKDWFCVKIQNDWHAVFGRYDTAAHSFVQILHYLMPDNGNAVKTDRIIDSSISNPAARSIRTCLRDADSLIAFYRSFYVNLNAYYEKDSTGKNRVWLLPGTTDEKAVYGIEMSFDLSPSGDSIIHKECTGLKLRYYVPDKNKEAVLGNDYADIPTLGNIFFALRHHDDFKKTVIYNKKWTSSLIVNPVTRELSWVHTKSCDAAKQKSPRRF